MSFLKKYEANSGEEILCEYYACTTDFLTNYVGYDIVFMDINFKNDMNGIKAAHKLREVDTKVTLIFVTSFEQFAVKGYEVEAFDFIVKPVTYGDFALRFSRAIKRVKKETTDVMNIKSNGGVKVVKMKDILYVEVIKHNLVFHTTDGNIECGGSLKETEATLGPQFFVRCNNCYLVNLRYVTAVEGYTVIVNKDELTISRPRKKEFLSELNRYLGR